MHSSVFFCGCPLRLFCDLSRYASRGIPSSETLILWPNISTIPVSALTGGNSFLWVDPDLIEMFPSILPLHTSSLPTNWRCWIYQPFTTPSGFTQLSWWALATALSVCAKTVLFVFGIQRRNNQHVFPFYLWHLDVLVAATLDLGLITYPMITRSYVYVFVGGGIDSISIAYFPILGTNVFRDTSVIESDLTCLYRNAIYCCMGHSDWTESQRIITFDFRSEVFGAIPLPDNAGNVVFRRHTLAIFRENIGCICQNSTVGSETCLFQIWMLSDYGLNESWIHLYTVGPSTEFWNPKMGFSRNEDLLVFERNNGQLCLYDLANQDVINLPIQGFWKSMCAMYEESLVSINRGSNAANQEQKMLTNTSLECIRVMPEELVSNILLRLPVASLLRFRCVCKSWCALIGSSDFVSQHLHHDKNNKLIVLIRGGYPLFENSSHPVPNASCACFLSSSKFEVLDLPYRKGWFFGELDIVASCNGIICLHHDDDPLVYFWNPAAKQLRALAKQGHGYSRGDDFSVGFGFDVKMNDYKVVIFLNCIYGSVAHVYCLSTDSWTSVDDVVPTHSGIIAALKVPYRNGIYCWLALSNTVDYLKIMISFDFSNEVFRTIPLPASIGHKSNLQLGVIRECIACIDVDYELVEGSWHGEIWGLSGYGYGIKENWHKIYTMGSFSNDWHFLMAFSDIGDFCLLLKNGELYMLELVAEEIKILPVQVSARESVCVSPADEVALCKESLVSIKR